MAKEKQRAFKKANAKGAGRPPLEPTDEVIANVSNAMRTGAYVETAAVYCGISKPVLYEWIKKGKKDPDSIYGKFINAVEKAWSDCDLRDLIAIEKAINPSQIALPLRDADGNHLHDKDGMPRWIEPQTPNVAAAQWRIARRNPKHWARTEKTMDIDDHNEEKGSSVRKITIEIVDPKEKS